MMSVALGALFAGLGALILAIGVRLARVDRLAHADVRTLEPAEYLGRYLLSTSTH